VIDAAILAAIEARIVAATAEPPVRRRRFEAAGMALGVVDDARAARLAQFDCFDVTPDAVVLDPRLVTPDARSAAIADVAATLYREGALPGWRDELYAVGPGFDAPAQFLIERGAARYFGVRTYAAHVNGVVHEGDTTRMWIARRSRTKAVDPNLLDNLVGGGIGAGFRVDQTVVKEAWEEAGIDEALARRARPAGIVCAVKPMFDGLQRETLFVHDLALPPDFVPQNQDGEAVEHRLVTLRDAARTIASEHGDDEVTLDASLVVLDYLIREGTIRPDQSRYCKLAALLRARR
jgi:8-oxo-dGTP pyrophosphatase MutT (NUDIX family)